MEYRLTANELLHTLKIWDQLITGRGKIHLIACGGTALTLLGYKESTKDVDLLIPEEKDYKRLVRFLEKAGYKQITGYGWKREGEVIQYDLFFGNRVFQTDLLSSPLEPGGNRQIWNSAKIYLGALNLLDLIITKMSRASEVDFEDCLFLLRSETIDLKELEDRYRGAAKYQLNEEKEMRNYELLMKRFKENKGGI